MTRYTLEVSFMTLRHSQGSEWTPRTVIAELSEAEYKQFIELHGSKFGELAKSRLFVTETVVKKGEYQPPEAIEHRKIKNLEFKEAAELAFGKRKP